MRYAVAARFFPGGNDWVIGKSKQFCDQPYFISAEDRFGKRFWTRKGAQAFLDEVSHGSFLAGNATFVIRKLTRF